MKRKTPRKLTLRRETLHLLAASQLSQAAGAATVAGQACSNPCVPRTGGDTADSCGGVVSCASCVIATCGCLTVVADCGAPTFVC